MRVRELWPLVAGVTAALVVLGITSGAGEAGTERFLGVPLRGWFVALLLISLGLSGQLVVSGRIALNRERRLVNAAASLRELTGQLELLATMDNLTGLYNRRVFFERLGTEFRRALRYGRPLSVIMAELDHFKTVNDRYCHPFGDLVLAITAQTIRTHVRESDLVARYGGEEFVLMLPETARAEAMVVAEKLRAEIEAQEYTNGIESTRITISLGVTSLTECAPADDDDLVRMADDALYAAKRNGRNRAEAAVPAVTPESGSAASADA